MNWLQSIKRWWKIRKMLKSMGIPLSIMNRNSYKYSKTHDENLAWLKVVQEQRDLLDFFGGWVKVINESKEKV